MALFGLDREEIQNGYDYAAQNAYDPMRDSGPGFFEGSLTALPTGFQQGGAEAALLFAPEDRQDDILRNLEALRPSPQTTGWLANVFQSVGSVIPAAAAGTITSFGNPIGGALAVGEVKGYAKIKELEVAGVDAKTAAEAGAIEGITQGAGLLLPSGVGGTLPTRLASGAAINVGAGALQRGSTGALLEAGGYKDMAAQYRVMDSAALFTDAILGAGFGALPGEGRAEPLPSEVDAALAASNIHHLELDTAPGIPSDIATRNAHIAAMDLGTEQLLRGEPVNVAERVADGNFIGKPQDAEARIVSPWGSLDGDLMVLTPPPAGYLRVHA